MRESVKKSGKGFLAKASVLLLAFFVFIALGFNPLVMQRTMANAATTHTALSAEMPAMTHEVQHGTNGGFCVQMAPCTAIMSQPSEMLAIGDLVARLAPTPLPLANSRALAPPFHPPII